MIVNVCDDHGTVNYTHRKRKRFFLDDKMSKKKELKHWDLKHLHHRHHNYHYTSFVTTITIIIMT